MILYPNAKINLGLRVLEKRDDGFHNIETIMLPVPVNDVLEVSEFDPAFFDIVRSEPLYSSKLQMNEQIEFNTLDPVFFFQENAPVGLHHSQNLAFRAYEIFADKIGGLPASVYIHLIKKIPHGAGMGGGSSDAAYTLRALNELSTNKVDADRLENLAMRLGSDCAFFIKNKPALATGRGEILTPININLKGYSIVVVKPDIEINTGWAYSNIIPRPFGKSLSELVEMPVDKWNSHIYNDFETPVFDKFPSLKAIKNDLYASGALYASLTGSGAALYGIFRSGTELQYKPGNYFYFHSLLN